MNQSGSGVTALAGSGIMDEDERIMDDFIRTTIRHILVFPARFFRNFNDSNILTPDFFSHLVAALLR